MDRPFHNVYGHEAWARAYADLGFPGSYWLAFRDIPELIEAHRTGTGTRALDFGCGAGRSTRFLKERGFDTTGVDISASMLERARERDPEGRYLQIPDGDLSALASDGFDLILSALTFDNVPGREKREHLFQEFRRVLSPGGIMINLVSSPDIYLHEWVSFSTKDFPENRTATSGDRVRIVMLDVPKGLPVEDVLWVDADYRALFAQAGLELVEYRRPLGREGEPFEWGTETRVSPWAIYVGRVPG
jgi:SAM-dependent methyltransferase